MANITLRLTNTKLLNLRTCTLVTNRFDDKFDYCMFFAGAVFIAKRALNA